MRAPAVVMIFCLALLLAAAAVAADAAQAGSLACAEVVDPANVAVIDGASLVESAAQGTASTAGSAAGQHSPPQVMSADGSLTISIDYD